MWWNFRPYVSAAERRATADRKVKQLAKSGRQTSPVNVSGRQIATTFWGRAWCDNLDAYSDFSNRLPRGRTYLRNGSVIDLQIQAGRATAMVSGSDLYNIRIELASLAKPVWKQVKSQCAGQIGSLVDLLQGKLSQDVMSIVTAREGGLFPKPKEIKMECSCPDYAYLCKHLAAVLYGIGARLDQQPELLFLLRQVDHLELISAAGDLKAAVNSPTKKSKAISNDALSEIFGIELDNSTAEPAQPAPRSEAKAKTASQGAPRASAKKSRAGDTAGPAKKLPAQAKATQQAKPKPAAKAVKRRLRKDPSPAQKKLAAKVLAKTRLKSKT